MTENPADYYRCICTTIRQALAGYDAMELAAWMAALNVWEWPEDCPIPKPLGWDAARLFVKVSDTQTDPATPNKALLMGPFWDVLDSLTTKEEQLHAAWLRMGRTTEAFREWWDANEDQRHAILHRDGRGFTLEEAHHG